MLLEIGKSYNLSTIQKSIMKKKVKIVGYLNYTEALKIPYNIRNLAINEKIINIDNEDDTYLESQQYYKCVILDSSNNTIETSDYVLVWDSIIDTSATTELDVIYSLSMDVTINPASDIQISEVMDAIQNYFKNNFNEEISISLKVNNVSSNVSIDSNTENLTNNLAQMEELLKQSSNSLLTLISLKNASQTLLDKITNLNVSTNLTQMSETLDVIQTTVEDIYSAVK